MKQKVLSGLEQEVMDIIWQEEKASVRSVLTILTRKKSIAYTTVATIIKRLEVKKLVKKEQRGLSYFYSPNLSKESYTKRVATTFMQKFFESFGEIGIISFAESIEKLPEEKRNYLVKLIKKHEAHT